MACSDNVVRAGLTPKYRDVETLCEILNYATKSANSKILFSEIENDFSTVYKPPVPEFAVCKINVSTPTAICKKRKFQFFEKLRSLVKIYLLCKYYTPKCNHHWESYLQSWGISHQVPSLFKIAFSSSKNSKNVTHPLLTKGCPYILVHHIESCSTELLEKYFLQVSSGKEYHLIPRDSSSIFIVIDGSASLGDVKISKGQVFFLNANSDCVINVPTNEKQLILFQAFVNV